jgi:hypothetical protein
VGTYATVTFSDMLPCVRRALWEQWCFRTRAHAQECSKLSTSFAETILYALAPRHRARARTCATQGPPWAALPDGRPKVELREQYDCIIIDTPPILPLSDISIFEEMVEGIIMVVLVEKTTKDVFQQALDTLDTRKLVGIVLNDAKLSLTWYYSYGDTKA